MATMSAAMTSSASPEGGDEVGSEAAMKRPIDQIA